MCYFVFLASPLTLSEIRSMLAPGLGADLVSSAEQRRILDAYPDARTVVRLLRGACSCDMVIERETDPKNDEAHLRPRYRHHGLSRPATIAALERHRRGRERRHRALAHWQSTLAEFVAEHARNAGESLYLLHFTPSGTLESFPSSDPIRLTAAQVRERPAAWLPSEHPVLVAP